MTARPRRRAWLVTLCCVLGLVAGWTLTEGPAAVGIGILVAVFILPEFVLVPLRIKRSGRAAAESRARRATAGPASPPRRRGPGRARG